MKVNINRPYRGEPTVNVELSVRELELWEALLGSSHTETTLNQIRGVYPNLKASYDEVSSAIGYCAYIQLCDAVKSLKPTIIKTVEFVYDKQEYGVAAKWRTLHVTAENSEYIEGLEDGHTFKKFLKSRILGGKIRAV